MFYQDPATSSSCSNDTELPLQTEEDGGTYAARSSAVSSLALSVSVEPRDRGSYYEPVDESAHLDFFWGSAPSPQAGI